MLVLLPHTAMASAAGNKSKMLIKDLVYLYNIHIVNTRCMLCVKYFTN